MEPHPAWVGFILSAGYLGQLIGAVLFGWLAEKIGRLPTLLITIVLFVSMDVACLFAWSGASMLIFRFFQGIGTGGEVPVASAYINEFIGAKKRGRFFLLYELSRSACCSPASPATSSSRSTAGARCSSSASSRPC